MDRPPQRRRQRFVPLASLLLTAGVISLHLTVWRSGGGLWRDEVNSVVLARVSLPELWANLHYDSFPLLWHLVLRAWIAIFGNSDQAIRGMGLFAGLSIVAALWWNAKRLQGRSAVPLVALLLLGYTSSFVVYGDSVRAYGLGMALGLFTFGLIWDLTERVTLGRALATLAVAAAGVHMTFYNSPLLLACCAGGAAVALRAREWWRAGLILGIGAVCGATVLVYVPIIARANSYVMMLRRGWTWQHWGAKLVATLSHQSGNGTLDLARWTWAVAGAVGFVVVARTLLAGARVVRPAWWARLSARQQAVCFYAAVTLCVDVVACIGFLHVLQYELQPWYYLLGLALGGACLDVLFGIVARGRWRVAVAGVALILATIAFTGETGFDVTVPRTNVDRLAGALQGLVKPGDTIVTHPWFLTVPLDYYYHGPGKIVAMPPVAFIQYHRFDQLIPFMRDPTLEQPMLADLGKTLKSGHRVWLMATEAKLLADPHPPATLPVLPAPSPKFGWSAAYYDLAWQVELLTYLRMHSVHTSPLAVVNADGKPVEASNFEKALLIEVSGWRE